MALSIDGDGAAFPRTVELAAWLEALGIRALVPGRSLAPPAPESLRAALPAVEIPAVRHVLPLVAVGTRLEGDLAGRDLVASDERSRERALERLVATVRWGRAARAPWVIVEPGSLEPFPDPGTAAAERERDQRLDRLCRALHAASRHEPEAGFALATPRDAQPWLTPAALEQVFEELRPARSFAYWHDAGRAHAFAAQGFAAASAWLDLHGRRCIGLDATDAIGAQAGLPAGAGEVDFRALLGALAAGTWITLRSEPFAGPGPLAAAAGALGAARGAGAS